MTHLGLPYIYLFFVFFFLTSSLRHPDQLINDVFNTCAVDLLSEVDGITICSHGLEELLST